MGKKYRIERVSDGQFFGHWQAHGPKDAIRKAIAAYQEYYPSDDGTDSFKYKRGYAEHGVYSTEEI